MLSYIYIQTPGQYFCCQTKNEIKSGNEPVRIIFKIRTSIQDSIFIAAHCFLGCKINVNLSLVRTMMPKSLWSGILRKYVATHLKYLVRIIWLKLQKKNLALLWISRKFMILRGIFCLTVKHLSGLPSSVFLGEVVMAGHTIK